MSLPARLLVFAACGLIGFFAANAFTPSNGSLETFASRRPDAAPPLKPLAGVPEESAMVAEWDQLRRDHGGEGADLQALYAAIKDTKDPYRRRAFRAALIAEWATRDPRAALAYLLQKDPQNVPQLMREWMRIDSDAAIAGILGAGAGARNALRGLQSDIARLAPGRLAEVVAALPKSDSRWDTSTQEAFAIFAGQDAAAARAAAESLTGPLRAQALAGVGKAWGEKDGAAALAWAQGLPAGEARDSALRGVLMGWAKTDPVAALDKIDLAPPGGDESYYASDVGAQVLSAAASRDWDATIRWLSEHPGKLGFASLNGLMSALSQRLVKDPSSTLREIANSKFPGFTQVFGNAVLNEGYMARDAIWDWLDRQPRSTITQGMRSSLLNAIGWKEPSVALEFLEKLPDTPEDKQLLERGTQSLLNGGQQMYLLEGLLEKASSKLRPYLIQAAFNHGGEHFSANPRLWLERLNEVPQDRWVNAMQAFARGWASSDPGSAVDWAMGLPDEGQRVSALSAAANGWVNADPHGAAEWANSLPAGPSRDGAAQALVYGLARQQPETAWAWALSIEASGQKMSALQTVYQSMRNKNPAIAEQMLQTAELTSEQIKTLKGAPSNSVGGFLRGF